MKEFFQGYKGSNRKFMAPVSESKFNADVMEFKDTNSNRVPFQMANQKGYSTRNADVIGFGDGNHRYKNQRKPYKLSNFSEESTYYQLDLGLASTDKVSVINIFVNGIKMNEYFKSMALYYHACLYFHFATLELSSQCFRFQ